MENKTVEMVVKDLLLADNRKKKKTVPAKRRLISSNGFSGVHECDRCHTDKKTDHAMVISVAISGIAFSEAA